MNSGSRIEAVESTKEVKEFDLRAVARPDGTAVVVIYGYGGGGGGGGGAGNGGTGSSINAVAMAGAEGGGGGGGHGWAEWAGNHAYGADGGNGYIRISFEW